MIRLDNSESTVELRSADEPFTWRKLAALQGAYYAATGVWSLLDMRSFQFVTGPKVDTWLVKTVGALVTTSGGALAIAAREREQRGSILALGLLSAVSLAAIDFTYVAKRRISPVYALDGVVELAIAALWVKTWFAQDGDGAHWMRTSTPDRTW